MRDLSPLLRPRSIAMIGASSDPARGNGRTLRYLIQGGFGGPLFPVNPRRGEIQGQRCWPSIGALPQAVDTAIVALPTEAVAQALRECAAAGARSAIVFAGGYAEMGEAGRQAQAEITRIARVAGMLLLGPNSLGAYDARTRSFMTFSSMFEEGFAEGGHLGMVTQSGGWGSQARRLAAERGLSILQWVSTGNEADLTVAEVLHAMTQDDQIQVILLYLEGVRDGARLRAALEAARLQRKPVVAIKVGRTAAGQQAAASHTASLAGEDDAFNALCARYGVHRADSIEELLDVAYAALHGIAHGRLPRGPGTAILSPSGGFAVHMTDQAERLGLQLVPTPPDTRRLIEQLVPNAAAGNPVDVTGAVLNRLPDFGRALDLLLQSGTYDGADIFVGMAGSAPGLRDQWVAALADAAQAHPGKWLAVSVLAPRDTLQRYEAAGYAVFEDTSRLMNAHGALVQMHRAQARAASEPPSPIPAGRFESAVSEAAAKRVLGPLGIATPSEVVCASAQAAAREALSFEGPLAVKVVSPDIAHKTEVGGVRLGLCGPAAVAAAVDEMAQQVAGHCPTARIEGWLLTEMAPEGVDCLVGLRHDPALGPVVVFGAGGVMTEWLQDVALRLAPVTPAEAREMVAETKIARLLRGYRGAPAADLDALARAISHVSRWVPEAGPPCDLELNPLRVLPAGRGVLALDALVTPAGA